MMFLSIPIFVKCIFTELLSILNNNLLNIPFDIMKLGSDINGTISIPISAWSTVIEPTLNHSAVALGKKRSRQKRYLPNKLRHKSLTLQP